MLKDLGVKNEKETSKGLESAPISLKEKEAILKSGIFEQEKDLMGGCSGGAMHVKIKDDGSGVFKPYSNHYLYSLEEKEGNINRERAVFLIDRSLGFNLVPPTIVRCKKNANGEEEKGSFQEFITDSTTASGFDTKKVQQINNNDRYAIAVLDVIIANNDRCSANFLIKGEKIYAIDHGLSLESRNVFQSNIINFLSFSSREIIPDITKESISKDVLDCMDTFLRSKSLQIILRQQLGELIGEKLALAYIERIKAFRESINNSQTLDEQKFKTFLLKNKETISKN